MKWLKYSGIALCTPFIVFLLGVVLLVGILLSSFFYEEHHNYMDI